MAQTGGIEKQTELLKVSQHRVVNVQTVPNLRGKTYRVNSVEGYGTGIAKKQSNRHLTKWANWLLAPDLWEIPLAHRTRFQNTSPVPKWAKLIIAILLLPICAGQAMALWRVVRACGGADTTFVPLGAGAACWLVIYLLLPKPMLIYVFGHELTHALWTWLFGGEVKRFKAAASGGHVVVSKTNFLITLAPYFFPLYAALVVLGFLAGHLVWGWKNYFAWFHLALGAAYAFHVTLTAHILKTRQTDITSQGYLFSAVVIFLGNLLVLLVGIPLLATKVDLRTAVLWWWNDTAAIVHQLARLL